MTDRQKMEYIHSTLMIAYDDKELDEGMLMQSIAFVEELREKFFKFTIEKKGESKWKIRIWLVYYFQ